MRLFYYTSGKNFGDRINPWFWSHFLSVPMSEDPTEKELILGIGTIINDRIPPAEKVHILGSGAGYGRYVPKAMPHWEVHWVRGPLTAQRIGVSSSKSIADPALLLHRLTPPPSRKDLPVSFMPHVGIDSARFERLTEDAGIHYISPTWEPAKVIDLVNRSERLICSAMHGAIVADALRVPWCPVVTSPEILAFKWYDWCTAMELEFKPETMLPLWDPVGPTVAHKVKARLKEWLVTRKLTSIVTRGRFFLSTYAVLMNRVARMEGIIAQFNLRFGCNSAVAERIVAVGEPENQLDNSMSSGTGPRESK